MRRTVTEMLHIAAGVVATALFASLAAWAVPLASRTIWQVAFVAMAAVVGMGLGQLREAWRADKRRAGGAIDPDRDKV